MLGAEQAAGSPSVGMQWRDPATQQTPPTAPPVRPAVPGGEPVPVAGVAAAAAAASAGAAMSSAAPASDPASRSATNRSEQLAEIREMLAEVQSEDRATALKADTSPSSEFGSEQSQSDGSDVSTISGRRQRTEPSFGPGSEATRVMPDNSDPQDDLYEDLNEPEVDPLRQRMAMHDKSTGKSPKPTDVKRLRKSHERRAKRRSRESAAGSGAFLTGFLLVAIIASVMISLYLLHPQIIARVPATEKPLTEYVATVDGLRVTVAETYEGVRGWVSEQLEGKV
ncbi:MAG: hypothetical protein AAGD13_03905 [Pseudomonadota bacterium]